MENSSYKKIEISKVSKNAATVFSDTIAVEEPLEIQLVYGTSPNRIKKTVSVTMRTPGNDTELAIGFLFTEGIIKSYQEIKAVTFSTPKAFLEKKSDCNENTGNEIQLHLHEGIFPKIDSLERNFYTTSSCGVCGKSSIQSIKTVSLFQTNAAPNPLELAEILIGLPTKLRNAQANFELTGGIHATGLFSLDGNLVILKEDVGRHNALDKLIGAALIQNQLPLENHLLLLSGRASFELIQKAAMAGISIVAAIGAPSSLAVELAQEMGITLIGFLKENSFNCY